MISYGLHRNVNIATRTTLSIVSVASLALFVVALLRVFDYRFPAEKPGYSALPVGALAFAILWNIIALITRGKLGSLFHRTGDILAFLVLVILGPIGFAHDANEYLSNGYYKYYDNAPWLKQAIVAGSLGLTAIVLQLFLVVWSFVNYEHKFKDLSPAQPPPYTEDQRVKHEEERDLKDEWQSVSGFEVDRNHVNIV